MRVLLLLLSITLLSPMSYAVQACYEGDVPVEEESWSESEPLCLDTVKATEMVSKERGEYKYPNRGGQYRKPTRYIDLEVVDEAQKVSPYFRLREFMARYKGRYGVFATKVVSHISKMREELGSPLYINSAYRNPTYNKSVGGVTNSRHMYGDGVDIGMASAPLSQLNKLCKAQNASFTLLYKTHIHCDWRGHPLDAVFYGMANFQKLSFVDIKKGFEEISSVEVVEEDGAVYLYADHPKMDDGHDDLLYFWKIEGPGGFEEKTTDVPYLDAPQASGEYFISVAIGGSIDASIIYEAE